MVRDLTCLGRRLNTSTGCVATVPARTGIGWVKFRECGKLIYGNWFALNL